MRQKGAQCANKMPLDLNASAASLKSRGIKGSLYEARGSFYWRVCVPIQKVKEELAKFPCGYGHNLQP